MLTVNDATGLSLLHEHKTLNTYKIIIDKNFLILKILPEIEIVRYKLFRVKITAINAQHTTIIDQIYDKFSDKMAVKRKKQVLDGSLELH